VVSRLYVATGSASPVPVRVVGAGASSFAWAPDGIHSVLVDAEGALHILPQDRVLPGPIRGVAFSPGGTLAAVCSGRAWPPRITLLRLEALNGQGGPSFEGCDPQWSADGTYVAYRIPTVPAVGNQQSYDPTGFGVLNTRVVTRFSVPGSWPVAWAPASDRTFVPLTVTGRDGRSVEIMDPRGGERRTLLSRDTLRAVIGNVPVGSISLLAWSPRGDRLAIGFGAGPLGRFGGVADVDPATGQGTFVGDQFAPVWLTWSGEGDLLAGFAGPGDGRTRLIHGREGMSTSLSIRDATWSADGRWILGRADDGWVIAPVDRPDATQAIKDSADWSVARWCCPPVPGVGLPDTGW